MLTIAIALTLCVWSTSEATFVPQPSIPIVYGVGVPLPPPTIMLSGMTPPAPPPTMFQYGKYGGGNMPFTDILGTGVFEYGGPFGTFGGGMGMMGGSMHNFYPGQGMGAYEYHQINYDPTWNINMQDGGGFGGSWTGGSQFFPQTPVVPQIPATSTSSTTGSWNEPSATGVGLQSH